MASLVDFYKSKLAPVGQKLSEVFRPQTGTIATAGRNLIQNIGNTQVQVPQSVANIANRIQSQGGFNRLSQEFKNPIQFTPLSMKSAAVDTGRKLGSEDLGYGLRGALTLTPFQSMGSLTPKLSTIQSQTSPTTGRQQIAQSIGQTVYGTALTAPLSAGRNALGTLGNITKNLAVGTGTGALMQGGSDLLTGNFSKDSLVQGALSGAQNSWVLPVTNSITDSAILKLFPKAGLKVTGAGVTDPFKLGNIKQGFGRLLTQSLAQVPAENTAFTFLNQLDDKTKGSFTENWIKNLPGNIVGNILSAGLSGSVNIMSNKASRKVIQDAMQKTADEWNRPVRINGGKQMPMWQYKMMYETKKGSVALDLGLSKDTPKLSVEPTGSKIKDDYPDPIENPLYDEMRSAQDKMMARVNSLGNKYKSDADIPKPILKELNELKADWNKKSELWKNTYSPSKPLSVEPTGGIKPIDTVNPTGSVMSKYDPQSRMKAPLGKNITTLDKTMGVSPEETITIYRGAPKTQKSINPGDFVTTNPQLAKDYAGNGTVISTKVKARDILDDITEPMGEEYIYRPPKPLSVEPVGGITDNANQFLSSVREKFPDNNEKEMFDYAKKISHIRGSKQIDTQDIAEAVQYSRKIKGLGEDVGFNSLFSKDRTGTEILDRMKEVGVKDIDTSIYNVRDQVKNKLISLDKDTQSFVEAIAKKEGLVDVDGRISKRGLEILNNIIPGGKPTMQDIAKKMNTYKKVVSPSPLGGKVGGEVKKVTPIRRPLKEVYKEQLTKGADILRPSTPLENIQPAPKALDNLGISTTPQPVSQTIQTVRKIKQLDQPSESIIQEARKQIGSTPEPKDKSIKEVLDDTYSSWVDRYNPLTKASNVAKQTLKGQGAELRPEYDPTYLVRRLTGAGGIADQRFRTELNPILKEMESLNIPKADMDVYLANKRMAGFGKAGRDIYGTDPVKSGQVVSALEAKYPQINGVAQKMYTYQDKGLKEIADAGFLSPESITALKSQNPDYAPLYRVMDEMDNYLGLPTRKTMQGTSPISKIKGSTRQIESPVESIIGNTFRQRAAIEKNRVAQSVVDLQKISPDLGFTKVSKSAPDTITVWKNGQKEYWKVGQDIADTAKGVNEESMNLLLKVLQAPASLLRQGATGRNPEFLLPNILRDNLDAGVTSKYGYIPFVDYFSGLISMAKNDDVYQKWANSGAKIDLGEISGKKSIQKLFDSKVEKKKLSTWLTQGLDVLGTLSEQPTRVGLFKKAYQKTGNEMLAMMESRDATVDFARMGSKMKVANSIIPFLNVGVQGFDKLIRAVKDSPGRVAFNAGIYGVLPALMTTLYNLNNDPESYNEIPQYEKDSNFVLVTGRNDDGTVDYLTFPKGNVIPSIANPIESFLAFTKNEDPEAFKRMLISTLTGTLPVIGDGSTAGEVATKTIGGLIPQGIKPIAENLLNKSFYKYDPSKEQSKDIVPSYLQNKPDYQQTYEFTPQMYQKLGAVFDASPLKVKNLMEGYLAGFTKIPAQIYEMAYKSSRGEEISPNDKTLMRRFFKQTYPSSGKAPQVKPESPGLMERVTGKVGAAETSVKKVIPEWQIDNAKTELKSSDKTSKKISDNLYLVKQTNGDVSGLDLSNVTKMPATTNYEQVKKETEKWKIADDILKLDPTDQVEAFKQLGISKDDAEYYVVAKDSVEAKAAYIKDQVQGVKTYDEFLTKVAPLTREVNGEKILSDGVVDWMYQNDIITSAQKKQLKALEYDNIKKVARVSAKKSSGTTKKITVKKLGKFNLAGRVKRVKRIRTKQYRLKI